MTSLMATCDVTDDARRAPFDTFPLHQPLVGRRFGHGQSIGHHGELLQGTFEDSDGLRHRALVTLPLPGLVTHAYFHPGPGAPGRVTVKPTWKRKAAAAAELILSRYLPTASGELVIHGAGAQPGLGLGSSTSDVTAALRAVADCYALPVTAADLARLAVEAEGASDSVMLDSQVVLFAHRCGHVLESFDRLLPHIVVVGCDTDPDRGGVDTLGFRPPEHTAAEIGEFRCLLGLLRHGLSTGSVSLLAKVAEASARINQRYLPTREFDNLSTIARETGGLGIQVSHSGTVAGILFDGSVPGAVSRAEDCQRILRKRGFEDPWVFHSHSVKDGR